jgi:D-arabinose 1-dehydrogenase-like Zn-dependent alcohol dehydrogenase
LTQLILSGIKACKLEKGQSLAIFGGGALGHLGCQFAKCLGLKTIVIDSRQPPLEMCKSLPYPPDVLYNSSEVDLDDPKSVEKAIKSIGDNTDAVIIATDALPAYKLGFEVVKKHGLFMVIGQPKDPIPVSFFPLIFKNVTIKGSLLSDSANLKDMVDLVAAKKIECKTNAYKLTEVDKLIVSTLLYVSCTVLILHPPVRLCSSRSFRKDGRSRW